MYSSFYLFLLNKNLNDALALWCNIRTNKAIFFVIKKTNSTMIPQRIYLAVIGMLIIILSACQKDDTPPCSYPKNAKLKRIVACRSEHLDCPSTECTDIGWIEEEYQSYHYNSKDQLEKIEYYITYRDEFYHEKSHIFSYSDNGQLIEEYIDWVDSDTYQYKLYKYTNNRLTRIENYKENSDELETYVLIEYDDSGNIMKETTLYSTGEQYHCMEHSYENGLNIQSDEYQGTTHIWTFLKTYDENNNLVLRERFHKTIKGSLKYEYYD